MSERQGKKTQQLFAMRFVWTQIASDTTGDWTLFLLSTKKSACPRNPISYSTFSLCFLLSSSLPPARRPEPLAAITHLGDRYQNTEHWAKGFPESSHNLLTNKGHHKKLLGAFFPIFRHLEIFGSDAM
jgi:hypothetical protein